MDLRVYKKVHALYSDLRAQGFHILVADLGTDAVIDPHELESRLAAPDVMRTSIRR